MMFGSSLREWPLFVESRVFLLLEPSPVWPLKQPRKALTLPFACPFLVGRCFNEAACISVPPVDGYVMVLQPEEPKISLSGVHHFARAASEFESSEGVFLFPELRIISTITREVEPEGEGDEDPTGNSPSCWDTCPPLGSELGSCTPIAAAYFLGPFPLGFGRF